MTQPQTVPFPKGRMQASRNGRGGKSKASVRSIPDDADARYALALKLVCTIDRNLQNGTHHYYDIQGRLLSTLDEVIHAMLTDSLAPEKPVQQDRALEWAAVSELVA